jgi:hypothetical protein
VVGDAWLREWRAPEEHLYTEQIQNILQAVSAHAALRSGGRW